MNTPNDASDTAITRLFDDESAPCNVGPPEARQYVPPPDPALGLIAAMRSPREQKTIKKQREDIERCAATFAARIPADMLDYIELCLSACYTEGWLERGS